jgi:hypothetical protein
MTYFRCAPPQLCRERSRAATPLLLEMVLPCDGLQPHRSRARVAAGLPGHDSCFTSSAISDYAYRFTYFRNVSGPTSAP